MRRSGGSSRPEFIFQEDNLLGIQLGSDFCAEHEWGIKDLKTHMKLISEEQADKKKIFGAERYKINSVHEYSIHFDTSEKDLEALLIFDPFVFDPNFTPSSYLKSLSIEQLSKEYGISLRSYKNIQNKKVEENIAAAWDSKSFGIHVKGEKEYKALNELYQHFISLDAILFLGKPPISVFSRSSLNIIIKSRIPKESIDFMHDQDKGIWQFKKYVEKTGIYEKLKKAGKTSHFLSPYRGKVSRDGKDIDSRVDIKFWLDTYGKERTGWFTIEELEEWAEGKGPIVKSNS